MTLNRFLLIAVVIAAISNSIFAQKKGSFTPEYSTAGFYEVPNSGREIYDFNSNWKFIKKDVKGAEKPIFDDTQWETVNTPNGLEVLPAEASGSINYQGIAWYRKHFNIPQNMKGKKIFIYFEAVMGKCKVWLNGKFITEHKGGYLPFSIDISNEADFDKKNVIAVMADNSNDKSYPPGTPQERLDFSYFGGIYRDVWLFTTNKTYITDPNHVNKVAGGGVFVHYENVSESKTEVIIQTDILNEDKSRKRLILTTELIDQTGANIVKSNKRFTLKSGKSTQLTQKLIVKKPQLWTPDTPHLYNLKTTVKTSKGKVVDAYIKKIGIRKIEFRGKEGFFLNGKKYHDKLIGANRHQDFGYIGNAMSNSMHWRDVKKLRDAGLRIIRSAHYPQDPAFMDACDALGMFIIVATPGWQFWNGDPQFAQLVYSDIRNMVRRDRNNPSVIMWEPILNETGYPAEFAKKTHETVHQEYPFQGAFTACDHHARGQEHFDVIYSHPYLSKFYKSYFKRNKKNIKDLTLPYDKYNRSLFTREWGDCVDDWKSHNSPSRVSKRWGEVPQLVQAKHYANPDYVFTSFEGLYTAPDQHTGGALWHSFDHQRGGHTDPFYGGIMDCFRQPKYSYHMFKSQRDAKLKLDMFDSGPMIYIAHEMTPFSPPDVTVYTNCDEVRIIKFENDTIIKKVDKRSIGIKHPPVVFKDLFNFMEVKKLHRGGKMKKASIIAEGLINGKVVIKHKRMPAKHAYQVKLTADNENMEFVANGSDKMVITAHITDKDGIIKRLNDYRVKFEVEGAAKIISSPDSGTNPCEVEWGTAQVIIQSTNKSGKIRIKAFMEKPGKFQPKSGEIIFNSVENKLKKL